jgi:hypothetical protein
MFLSKFEIIFLLNTFSSVNVGCLGCHTMWICRHFSSEKNRILQTINCEKFNTYKFKALFPVHVVLKQIQICDGMFVHS